MTSKPHIMHSDVVKTIKEKNQEYVDGYIEDMLLMLSKYTKKIESCKSSDECLIINVYLRKGNDLLTLFANSGCIRTSTTQFDKMALKNGELQWAERDESLDDRKL